jgi:hypothetical protein
MESTALWGLFAPNTDEMIRTAHAGARRFVARRRYAKRPPRAPRARVWEARPSPGRSLVRYGVVGGTSIVWIIRIALSRPPSYSTSLRYPSHPPFRSATPRHPGHPPSAALLNSRSLAPTRLDACGYCCSQGQRSTWDPGDAVLRPLEPLESWGRLGDGGRQAGSQAARIPPSRPR